MIRKASFFSVCSAAMLLAGCAAASDKYPSLEIRDVERVQGSFETAGTIDAVIDPVPPSADVLARLPALLDQASAAHADFTAATPRAAGLIDSARNAAPTSTRWADAQVALSDLESIRSRTAAALAELDILYVNATVSAEANGQIGEVRDAVTSLVADEDVTLAALRGQT